MVHNVGLYFNGKQVSGWTALTITHHIDQICATWAGKFPRGRLDLSTIDSRVTVEIRIDGETHFLGFIEKYTANSDDREAFIELTGRNFACDLVDSSITDDLKSELGTLKSTGISAYEYLKEVTRRVINDVYPSYESTFTPTVSFYTPDGETPDYQKQSFTNVAQIQVIDAVEVEVADSISEELNIESATKAFNIINGIAKKLGITLTSDAVGNLIFYRPRAITKSYSPYVTKALRLTANNNANVLKGALSYDTTDCFHTYKITGQDGALFETVMDSKPIYSIRTVNAPADNTDLTAVGIRLAEDAFNMNYPGYTKVQDVRIYTNTGARVTPVTDDSKYERFIYGFESPTLKQPIVAMDKEFRTNRYTEVVIDSGLDKTNLRAYLDNVMSKRKSESRKYTASVLGANYFPRDYVQIQDDNWGFNATFIVQSCNISITDTDIRSDLVCVSSNTYTSENSKEIHNSAEFKVGGLPKASPIAPYDAGVFTTAVEPNGVNPSSLNWVTVSNLSAANAVVAEGLLSDSTMYQNTSWSKMQQTASQKTLAESAEKEKLKNKKKLLQEESVDQYESLKEYTTYKDKKPTTPAIQESLTNIDSILGLNK